MSNPFERFAAERAPPRSRKKRRNRKLERKMAEQSTLSKLAILQRNAEVRELLEGPYGEHVRTILASMEHMAPAIGIGWLIDTASWLKKLPPDIRHRAFQAISRSAIALREQTGLEPFDDGLPWEPASAIIRIREILDGDD